MTTVEVVEVMRELDIDLSRNKPKRLPPTNRRASASELGHFGGGGYTGSVSRETRSVLAAPRRRP